MNNPFIQSVPPDNRVRIFDPLSEYIFPTIDNSSTEVVVVGRYPLLSEGISVVLRQVCSRAEVNIRHVRRLLADDLQEIGTCDLLIIGRYLGDDYYEDIRCIKKNNPEQKIIVFSEVLGNRDWDLIRNKTIDLFLPMSVDLMFVEKIIGWFVFYQRQHFEGGYGVTQYLSDRFMPDINDLSKKEIRLMSCLQYGLSNKAIADILNVCEHTVKRHMSAIFKKLNIYNRVKVAKIAHSQMPFVSR